MMITYSEIQERCLLVCDLCEFVVHAFQQPRVKVELTFKLTPMPPTLCQDGWRIIVTIPKRMNAQQVAETAERVAATSGLQWKQTSRTVTFFPARSTKTLKEVLFP